MILKYSLIFLSVSLFNSCLCQQMPPLNVPGGKPVSFVPPPPRPGNPDLAKLSYGSVPVKPNPLPVPNKPLQSLPNLPVNTGPTSTTKSYAGAVVQNTPAPSGGKSGPTTPSSTKKPSLITDPELRTFSEELLSKDVNNVAKYVTINLQGKLERNDTSDKAPLPLLTVKPEAYKIPTIVKFRALFDNYVQDAGVNEQVTPLERNEENDFLDTIIPTPVMQHARKLLMDKGLISPDPKDFKDMLKRLWFTMYSRGEGKIGSSGFEHVFLSEVKKGSVTGVHNWIYFNDQEISHNADYLGYVRNINLGDKGQVLKIRFKLNNMVKALTSLFVGTSPEFEIALFSVCYMLRADSQCPVRMNGVKFNIKTYNIKYRGASTIGSAFAEIS